VALGRPPAIDVSALSPAARALRRQLHETIQKVGDDYGRRYTFNTAIAAVMELLNSLAKYDEASANASALRQEAFEAVTLLLNPITPHTSHALWQKLGHAETTLEDLAFPKADAGALLRDLVTLAVQVNGKLRGTIEVAIGTEREEIERLALADANVVRFMDGLAVRKIIVVPGKIVNIVAA
jgi:leucyl-tRNA synthetase